MVIKEVVLRYKTRKTPGNQPKAQRPEDVVGLMKKKCVESIYEKIWVLHTDSKLHIRNIEEVVSGGVCSVGVEHAQIFAGVLKAGLRGFVVVHNHPSGDPKPSAEDLALTRRIQEGAKILGLSFHDHIIIGEESYVSLGTEGYMNQG